MTERVCLLPAAPPLPQEAGAADAVFGLDPSCENGVQESPQTFLNPEIKKFSAEYAQSKAEGILNRPAFGVYHAKPHLEKYRSRLPSCHKKGFRLRCAARCHAWMAVYWGTRYALPRVRIFWVRSASSTYIK